MSVCLPSGLTWAGCNCKPLKNDFLQLRALKKKLNTANNSNVVTKTSEW